ncbi:MAG: DUF3037 domain-containing protein [Flavobacteriales bacterium]|nr:DUF3037 domain-containing protein [Flavobacteriales bacterium]
MPEQHLYEYAVVRLLPVLAREEFVNVGIILFSKHAGFIKARVELNENRLRSLRSDLDLDEVRENLHAFTRIAHGDPKGGPISTLDIASRFRWLTAVRSSAIQTSRPHPGLCADLDGTVDRLFEELVH